ncbi:hypothetical protein [Nocardia sp. NPDC050406]|uniref:hypothetical protein n=1 Tax=Nocardia sp. NPDC050406 TaxID=3364318 RepID=UPI0037BC3037
MSVESRTASIGSAPRPMLLHALLAGIDFERYFRWRRERDGDPFTVRFPGFGSALFTGGTAGAREMFTAPPELSVPPLPNPIEPMVGPASLILTGGGQHRRDRALLAPAFHGSRIRNYGNVIREAAERSWPGSAPGSRGASGCGWTRGPRREP